MIQRRHFIGKLGLGFPAILSACTLETAPANQIKMPLVVSTWKPNTKANAEAWNILAADGSALDAVHAGVQVPEADPLDTSVGLGGMPDRDGKVTLDACIMDHLGNCGAVMALEHILHPISVARKVMEQTPHVQLAGEGALQFAIEMGFEKTNLLTDKARLEWEKWLKKGAYDPTTTIRMMKEFIKHQHDTIGMLALDKFKNMAGACTTSGMAFKLRGRVGDSPIIGAGLYVDNEVGAASATGVGEEIVRICGSHLVVESMRNGKAPQDACKYALERLVKMRGKDKMKDIQVGLIAINREGAYGCYALQKDFTMAVHTPEGPLVIEAPSIF